MTTKRTLRWSVTRYFTIRLGSPWQLATPFLKHASTAHVQVLPSTIPRTPHGLLRYRACIREEYLRHWAPTVASEPLRLFIAHHTYEESTIDVAPAYLKTEGTTLATASHLFKCNSPHRRTTAVNTHPPSPTIHLHHRRNMTIRATARLRICK
jgi:hypothetical protein